MPNQVNEVFSCGHEAKAKDGGENARLQRDHDELLHSHFISGRQER
jgi:hypothetical protein